MVNCTPAVKASPVTYPLNVRILSTVVKMNLEHGAALPGLAVQHCLSLKLLHLFRADQ